MCRKLTIFILLTTCVIFSNRVFSQSDASNARSDSLDVIHTEINLEVLDFNGKSINGNAVITLVSKLNNISHVNLDLLKLNVDSVLNGNSNLTYAYNDTLLRVNLLGSLNQGDTMKLNVFYRGVPQIDQSNWGGFYFNAGYAFNLGVGFEADPHNYGRVWFPCFDNFVERSTYLFNIYTSDDKKAHCSGELIAENVVSGDTIVRTWKMDESIPSYLVGLAVAEYETVHMSYAGLSGNVPIELAAKAQDTTKAKNAFINLDDAMAAFEYNFGPFLFNKVGYSFVPFGSGAMEHAANIAYPLYAISGGSTGSETLMAHELAHHWWGNLVTCKTAEDMWINEGMASYCEQLFLEYTYDVDTFKTVRKDNLDAVLQYAHVREDEYRSVSGVPHEFTYGMHVYDKGAVVAHNLRAYLGDSLYRSGMKYFLNKYQFSDVNSELIRDELSSFTGIDLTDFFDDWIFNPGFSHFQVDSIVTEDLLGGQYDVSIYVRQKLKGATLFHNNVPLMMKIIDKNLVSHDIEVNVSGQQTVISKTLDYEPLMAFVNSDENMNLAQVKDEITIQEAGDYELKYGRMNLKAFGGIDSVVMRVEHHWVAPDNDQLPSNAAEISDYHYWTVHTLHGYFVGSAEIYYDGRNSMSNGNGQLDNDLLEAGEDSVILLYRPNSSQVWKEYQFYSRNQLVTDLDKYGKMELHELLMGEYALATGTSIVGIKKKEKQENIRIKISPNPVLLGNTVTISTPSLNEPAIIEIYDLEGKKVFFEPFNGKLNLQLNRYQSGTYVVLIRSEERAYFSSEKLIIQN